MEISARGAEKWHAGRARSPDCRGGEEGRKAADWERLRVEGFFLKTEKLKSEN